MNKSKKVKICGFLTALVIVFGIAGSQSTTKAIFFQSAHKRGTLNAAYSAARANPKNMGLWKRVAELAKREVRILEATGGDQAQIANAKTNAACAAAKADPKNLELWESVADSAKREIMILEAIGDPIQSAIFRAKLASARANAAIAKAKATPRDMNLWANTAILAEREAAAWETVGNQANAALARANAFGSRATVAIAVAEADPNNVVLWETAESFLEREIAECQIVRDTARIAINQAFTVRVSLCKAIARVTADPNNIGLLENAVTLAEREAVAWQAVGENAQAGRSATRAAKMRAEADTAKVQQAARERRERGVIRCAARTNRTVLRFASAVAEAL